MFTGEGRRGGGKRLGEDPEVGSDPRMAAVSDPESLARLSPAEEAFERWRRRVGLVASPAVGLLLAWMPLHGLTAQGHALVAILGAVVVLWVTEALPMAATALLGPTLGVVFGVASAKEMYRPFADPIIFLFIGSFMLVEAMMQHGLNRRLAFLILNLPGVGESSLRLYAAFGVIVMTCSMWVSNAATTAMMLPIGIAIASEIARRSSALQGREVHFTTLPFATGLMLLTAFGASMGGMATPIGTPPNLIGIGMIERTLGVRIGFFDWMRIGVPIALVLTAFLVLQFQRVCPVEPGLLRDSGAWLAAEQERLGPWTRPQRNILIVFGTAVALWVLPGIVGLWGDPKGPFAMWLAARLPESVVAILAACALFAWPVDWRRGEFILGWREAVRIDWGTIFLFAGGMALGEQMFTTGVARWIGDGLVGIFPARTELGFTILFTAVAILVSEATSNTASATMVVPVAIAVAQAAGVPPLKPALAACIGSSMGFLMPVSTGPNAIVYGSGCVPLRQMMRHGIVLDVVGFVVIVTLVSLLA